jgi:hypothetical protein
MNHLKIRKYHYLLIAVLLFLQCKKRDKLPMEQMTLSDVLTDIHIAEASVDNETAEMKDSITHIYYPQIYERHGIKQWQFDSSMSMMSRDPILMERVFQTVIDNISKKYIPDSLSKKK